MQQAHTSFSRPVSGDLNNNGFFYVNFCVEVQFRHQETTN